MANWWLKTKLCFVDITWKMDSSWKERWRWEDETLSFTSYSSVSKLSMEPPDIDSRFLNSFLQRLCTILVWDLNQSGHVKPGSCGISIPYIWTSFSRACLTKLFVQKRFCVDTWSFSWPLVSSAVKITEKAALVFLERRVFDLTRLPVRAKYSPSSSATNASCNFSASFETLLACWSLKWDIPGALSQGKHGDWKSTALPAKEKKTSTAPGVSNPCTGSNHFKCLPPGNIRANKCLLLGLWLCSRQIMLQPCGTYQLVKLHIHNVYKFICILYLYK